MHCCNHNDHKYDNNQNIVAEIFINQNVILINQIYVYFIVPIEDEPFGGVLWKVSRI